MRFSDGEEESNTSNGNSSKSQHEIMYRSIYRLPHIC